MKNFKYYSLLIVLCIGTQLRAQDTIPTWNDSGTVNLDAIIANAFTELDLSEANTGYLQNKGASFFVDSLYYGDTLDSANTVNYSNFLGMYASVNSWRLNSQSMDSLNGFKQTWDNNTDAETLAVAMLHVKYNAFKSDIISNNLIEVISDQYHDVESRTESPYLAKHLVAATTKVQEHKGLNCTFYFPSSLKYIDNGMSLSQLQVDFGDGNGYQNISFGNYKAISYSSPGQKEIKYKLDYGSGNEFYTHSTIQIIDNSFLSVYQRFGDYQEEFAPVSGSNGHSGAVVTVDLGCGHTKLTKPLIIVEGYDPGHSISEPSAGFESVGFMGYNDAYRILIDDDADPLEEELSDGSYGIVFVDFYDGVDDIKRNARLLEEVLEWVNTTKAQNQSQEPNVVIGFSMGGIVARWALKTMENESKDHDTRLYVSFDSPHKGAYVPVSVQYMIRHLQNLTLAGYKISDLSPEFQDAVDMLNAPATKQLLLYQALKFPLANPNGSTTINGVHNGGSYNNQGFLDELGNLGYPQNCRMVAIANGSQINIEQAQDGTALGDNAMLIQVQNSDRIPIPNWVFPIIHYTLGYRPMIIALGSGYKAFFDVKALPESSQGKQVVYYGKLTYSLIGIGLCNLTKVTVSFEGTDCLEQKPGGIFDTEHFGFDLSAIANIPGTSVNFNRFCFIPTVSALDVNTPTAHDYNYHIKNANILSAANKRTPFYN